jgi:hypothetical protein
MRCLLLLLLPALAAMGRTPAPVEFLERGSVKGLDLGCVAEQKPVKFWIQ